MRKIGVILSLILLPTFVFAQSFCSDTENAELKSAAGAIKVNYVEKEGIVPKDHYYLPEGQDSDEEVELKYYYFDIEIINLTKDFYIIASNNINDEEFKITYSDASEGKYVKSHKDLNEIITFTFKIYKSSETNCKDELIKELYLTLPRFNSFFAHYACEGVEDLDVCQKYVTFKELPFEQMLKKTETARRKIDGDEEDGKTKLDKTTIEKFYKNYKVWIYFGGAIVFVIIGGLVTVMISKKRRKI